MNCFQSVTRFANNRQIFLNFEERPQSLSNDIMVVC
jgi:hypothetical protein